MQTYACAEAVFRIHELQNKSPNWDIQSILLVFVFIYLFVYPVENVTVWEKHSRMHLGGASMGLHLPDSWQTTEVVMGPARRKPGLHWYMALAPKVKSCPTILPFTGGTGIPQDMTGAGKRDIARREGDGGNSMRGGAGAFVTLCFSSTWDWTHLDYGRHGKVHFALRQTHTACTGTEQNA